MNTGIYYKRRYFWNKILVLCEHLISELIKMDTSQVVSWHIKMFKVFGLWPPKDNPVPYIIWSVAVAIFVFIFHSLFKLSSVIFVISVDDIIRILLMSSAIVTISLKALIVRVKTDTFSNLLDSMKDMDGRIQLNEYQKYLEPLIKKSRLIFTGFTIFSYLSWVSLIHQIIITPPEERVYLSTYYYPYESLRQPMIYIGGLVYEAIANFFLVPIFVALNFSGVMMLCILVGYINILCERLRSFGNYKLKNEKSELIDICEMYLGISR